MRHHLPFGPLDRFCQQRIQGLARHVRHKIQIFGKTAAAIAPSQGCPTLERELVTAGLCVDMVQQN